jgi:hypothetical protein
MSISSAPLRDRCVDLCWSLWTELGVPGVTREHEDFAMDVEPLLLFTARFADRDPRLRDESVGWAVRHQRYVSRARLRALIRVAAQDAQPWIGPYIATIALRTPGSWPGATEPWPEVSAARTSGRRLRPFDEPSLIRLRLRALLGVGARAEIAQAFVARPDALLAASELAELSGFTKSNINQELEAFSLAGLLQRSSSGNRLLYRLRDPERLLRFAGSRPPHFPDWAATLQVLGALLTVHENCERSSTLAASVEAAGFLDSHRAILDRAGFPTRPPQLFAEDLWEWFESTTTKYATRMSRGELWS